MDEEPGPGFGVPGSADSAQAGERVAEDGPGDHQSLCEADLPDSTTQYVILVAIALGAMGGFVSFGGSVSTTARCLAARVADGTVANVCGVDSTQATPGPASSRAPAADSTGPICSRDGCPPLAPACFEAGTPVLTPQGPRALAQRDMYRAGVSPA